MKSWTDARAKARLPAVWDRSATLERSVVAVVLLLTVWGIGSFGIWDPWELVVADAARGLGESGDTASTYTPLSTWMVGAAFRAFGIHEWSGRLPGVVAGWLTCLLTLGWMRRHVSRLAGVVAIAVLASTPLFLLNARLLCGDVVEVLAQTWVGLLAFDICSAEGRMRRTLPRWVLLALGIAFSAYASGVLLGPLPPMAAVAAWRLLSDDADGGDHVGRWLLPGAAVILTLGVIHAIWLDDPERSLWLGAGAVGGNPPTFDKGAELVFHGFAPWSAALPVAVIWALVPRSRRDDATQRIAWVFVLWAAFAFTSWTVFSSRYGTPPFLALVPLAGLVAIWMQEVSAERVTRWPAAVVVALLVGLLIRDYALYPDSPLRALAVDGLTIPDVYHPNGQWALLFSIAGALLCLMLVSPEGIPRPGSHRITRWVRSRWQIGWSTRVWLLLAASLLGACFAFGLLCLVLDLRIPSALVRAGKLVVLIPFSLAGLIVGLPWVQYAYGRLASERVWPAIGGGLAVGAFVTLSFQPALSLHFSPKPVYEAYGELTAGRPEPLATYKLPSTAAHYYTNAPIADLRTETDLLRFLRGSGQRWAVIPANDLPALDRAYRRETGEHLYVADARSARLLLIAAKAIAGRPNESFIASAILKDAPEPQHPVGASYEDQIELLGYDLELPGGDSVGAGQRFQVTWYWRVVGRAPSGYQVFVHIDGHGMRLNGDHVPVGGRYPTQLWDHGDVIVDTQELRVPANYPVGDYTIYIGLFSGSTRLEVKSGLDDGDNRVDAGALRVR
jgi:4-amino-4-deoxy-L-arabinose transferase-like glycosyltransferase